MPLLKNIQFGKISGYEVGFKVDTLYEILNTKIHETKQCWRVTKGGVPSVLLRPKDLDEGDKVIIVFEPNISRKAKEIASLTAFQKNVKNQLPIRLVRPYTAGGQYSPLFGYRYDGLYKVTEVNHVDKEKVSYQVFIHLQLLPEQPVFWEREPKMSLSTAEMRMKSDNEMMSAGKINNSEIISRALSPGNTSETDYESDDSASNHKQDDYISQGTMTLSQDTKFTSKKYDDDYYYIYKGFKTNVSVSEEDSDLNLSDNDYMKRLAERILGSSFEHSSGETGEANNKKLKLNLLDDDLCFPLERGWKRETVVKGFDQEAVIQGDVTYIAPCGKVLKHMEEVNQMRMKSDNEMMSAGKINNSEIISRALSPGNTSETDYKSDDSASNRKQDDYISQGTMTLSQDTKFTSKKYDDDYYYIYKGFKTNVSVSEEDSDLNLSDNDYMKRLAERILGSSFEHSSGETGEANNKKRKLNLLDDDLCFPLERGWKRETVVKGFDQEAVIQGDVTYIAPCGKVLKHMEEVNQMRMKSDNEMMSAGKINNSEIISRALSPGNTSETDYKSDDSASNRKQDDYISQETGKANNKKQKLNLLDDDLCFPLERGWKRETVVNGFDQEAVIQGDVTYIAPTMEEVNQELIHKQAENHKDSKNEAEPTIMVPEEEPQASNERVVEKRNTETP